eukprot:7147487-Alexandrium_andersonii.AAC.1
MSPRPPRCRPVVLEFAAMSGDGIMYDSAWGVILPRRACVSVQLGDFAAASRLVAVFEACDGYLVCVENER